ncbi:MAG: autoinducer binding domain-containing protein [Pseudoruegeria sp.]
MQSKVEDLCSKLDNLSHRGVAIGLCFEKGRPHFSHFSYSQAWLDTYTSQDLAKTDATLHFGMQKDGFAYWTDLRAQYSSTKTFDAAARFGLVDGFCIATTVDGRKSIASISLQENERFGINVQDELFDLFRLASLEISRSLKPAKCSIKTLEYLQLAANGADDKQVAEQLGMTIHGARARRKAALTEIGADTPAQAIFLAIQRRVLNPYAPV